MKRNALGRGLDSLIPMDDVPAVGTSAINTVPLSQITPNPDQPRQTFAQEALDDLTRSIRTFGVLQPISLRQVGPQSYQIIAGERRYRAALAAGLNEIPAYIRDANEQELTEMALIENIQREDLNPIEIALTYNKLIDQYHLTQEQLSERIGKSRAAIANALRMLRLHADVQLALSERRLTEGHARAILRLDDHQQQNKLFHRILAEDLSVRRAEELAKEMLEGVDTPARKQPLKREKNRLFDELKQNLSARFAAPVQLHCDANGKGRITFSFRDQEQLTRLIALFDQIPQQ